MRKNTIDNSVSNKEYLPLKWSKLTDQHGCEETKGGQVYYMEDTVKESIKDSIDWQGLSAFKITKNSGKDFQ